MDNLKFSLPRYRAANEIYNTLVQWMVREGVSVGEPFLSDRQVMELTGKSRTVIRRALGQMQQDGWIERRGGVGTFVGPRVMSANDPNAHINVSYKKNTAGRPLRIGIILGGTEVVDDSGTNIRHTGSFENAWYTKLVLRGINEVAAVQNIVLELVDDVSPQANTLSHRLQTNPPDLILCIGPPMYHTIAIGEAKRRGIPVVLTLIKAPEIGIHNVYEDSLNSGIDVVEYLAERGHRRIGIFQVMSISGWWVFERVLSHFAGLKKLGLPHSESLALWLPLTVPNDGLDMMRRYMERERPTALVCSSYQSAIWLSKYIEAENISIPRDLSVVVYDQQPFVSHFLGDVTPVTVALPIHEIGRYVGENAHKLVESPGNPPESIALPCKILPGNSVRPLTDAESNDGFLRAGSF